MEEQLQQQTTSEAIQGGETVTEALAKPNQPPSPTLAEALAALEQRGAELSDARAALAQRDAELAGLRGQLSAAAAKYRDALLIGAPEVPPELVGGVTTEELDASLAKARQMVERIRSQGQPQAADHRIPAGAPVRSAPDYSALSPQEKIAYALTQRR